ncbi:MAG: phosphatidate cytidylyltransferase [Planctomycetota bacterium]|nr:phosphatidate cytidylyltransferase [Planctomycetota bacterium]
MRFVLSRREFAVSEDWSRTRTTCRCSHEWAITTVVSLLVAAAAAYGSIHLNSVIPLLVVSVGVIVLSFFELLSFVDGRLLSKVLLFASCSLGAHAIASARTGEFVADSFIVFDVLQASEFSLAIMLLFASVSAQWFGFDRRKASVEAGVVFVAFAYFALACPMILRLLLHPEYVLFDPDMALGAPKFSVAAGVYFFLATVLCCKMSDIGAFLGGYFFGKKLFNAKKMAPRISPKKTYAGLLFGLLAAWAFGFAAMTYNPFGRIDDVVAVLFGLVVGVFAVGGDLFMSVLKRSFRVKDTGKTLPGIGGWLDLSDSVFWAGPPAYFLLMLNYHLVTA